MEKIIFILSEKSSGSSFLSRLLRDSLHIVNYPVTQHFEDETLYWTKAASMLDMPQLKMLESSVPFTHQSASLQLNSFVKSNLGNNYPVINGKLDLFKAWLDISEKFGPIFIEKSPHHLLQCSVLSLLLEFKEFVKGSADVYFIGIVRNPLKTAYSQFRRWQIKPSDFYEQWKITYMNWLAFSKSNDACYLVRYESLASNKSQELNKVLMFLGLDPSSDADGEGSRKTKSESTNNPFFKSDMDESTINLAYQLGYSRNDFVFNRSLPIPICNAKLALHKLARKMYRLVKPYQS